MGYQLYLRIPGIPGGCAEEHHADWIELEAFSQSLSQTGEEFAGDVHQDFSLTKMVDRSTPLLARSCAEGRRFAEAVLEVCRREGERECFMTLRLWDVRLIHHSMSGSSVAGDPSVGPYESLSLRYAKVEWSVEPRAQRPGRLGAPPEVRAAWATERYQELAARKR
jgi:type VI secretion system secreted protein Hcp